MDKLINQEMFFLLAGPCVIEGEEMALNIAEHVKKVTDRLGIPYVFKGSVKKANRSRLDSFTGIGDEKALKILAKVKAEFGIPVVTDIHTERGRGNGCRIRGCVTDSGFLVSSDGFVGGCRENGKNGEYQERTVPFSRGHEIRRG